MAYVDGFCAAVPAANKEKFIKHAKESDAVFLEYGATRIVECWGDDVMKGETTDFFKAVKATEDEVVLFSWVEWPDKATRDAGMKKVMDDPRMKDMKLPFDGKRMIVGGFSPVVTLGS